ncbi:lytic polysaccharide monooxygenase [Streptomyces sp. NPDC088387]|uniref:lytic polysaccharide monooxygenase auxiliary activity family 9 protein n=1 Tax=Streptomyces sp. NPDC088387 TaxID=3365859 RepID=UPI0037F972F4
MARRTAYRAAAAATVAGPLLLGVWAAGPASAHGAPTDPVSRVYACSPDGGAPSGSAACRAAVAANGAPFTAWDNLRIAGVDGRDRQVVPDGELCSGGLPAYRGLDLARTDWPTTRLSPGGTLNMTYVSTIPHTGTFRLYLTEPGYDPGKPLRWSDLPAQPFAEIRDPALTDGAYRLRAELPANRSGRHVLYTVWQNSSTPDTYYSCSDVEFPKAEAEADKEADAAGTATRPAKTPKATPPTAAPTPSDTARPASDPSPEPRADGTTLPGSTPAAAPVADGGPSAPLLAGGAAVVLLLTGGTALALRLRRR